MAQLVARLVRNEKVGGSNPPSSTTGRHPIRMSVFCMPVSGVAVPGCRVACGAAGVPGAAWGPGCLMCPWAAAFLLYVACGLTGVSGRRRARPPARSPHASPKARSGRSRSPPVPSGPSGVLHTGGALGYRTERVGFVATFWLAGAGKSTLKVVVSSWGYEYPQMPGVRASDDQVWALSIRGAAMALLPVRYQPGQPH